MRKLRSNPQPLQVPRADKKADRNKGRKKGEREGGKGGLEEIKLY